MGIQKDSLGIQKDSMGIQKGSKGFNGFKRGEGYRLRECILASLQVSVVMGGSLIESIDPL